MTRIYAHRGANKEAAENTRSAFDKALEYAIDGIETDVQLSRDEVAVLWHDRYLGKIGFPDKHIDDYDYAQLQAMNFAAHFSFNPLPIPPPDTGEGNNESLREFQIKARPESLLTLKEFLDAYRRRCRLLIEIKNRAWEPVCRHEIKVRQTLEYAGQGAFEEIMVSSFNLDSLIYAHRCAPQFPLVYNLEPEQKHDEVRAVLTEQPFLHGLCLPIASLDVAMVGLLRAHHKCIAVYTCNSDEEINRALALKVDILISDIPQKALQMRDQ